MKNDKIVVFSGAGVSAESGLKTFRDQNGLWEGHDVTCVASISGWNKNQKLVLDFYNKRRRQLKDVKPNDAHFLIANLESYFDTWVVTQNVDNLHERAGSKKVIHLHGELVKVKSVANANYSINWEKDLNIGDLCPKGHQLRPDIVWFGESVPMLVPAIEIVKNTDILIIIGTSLQVYPAASIIYKTRPSCAIYYIDPNADENIKNKGINCIKMKATSGMKKIYELLHLKTPY